MLLMGLWLGRTGLRACNCQLPTIRQGTDDGVLGLLVRFWLWGAYNGRDRCSIAVEAKTGGNSGWAKRLTRQSYALEEIKCGQQLSNRVHVVVDRGGKSGPCKPTERGSGI